MFDYKFHKLKANSGFFKFTYSEQPREIIREYAQKGWRFVEMIPLEWDSHGKTKWVELIFERPKGWDEDSVKYAPKTI